VPADLPTVIARELSLPRPGVERALALFAEGATLPFVARYRKEQTGNLDEVALGSIRDRHAQLVELEARRATVLASIEEQGKLTGELRARILAVTTRTALEDLYLPYRPRRRTRATMARERGLEPLADEIWAQRPTLAATREALGRRHLGPEVPDVEAAWQGARDIVAERVSDDADVRAALRDLALARGVFAARAVAGKATEGEKYKDYFDYSEPAKTIPSHRALALRRGEKEGFLRVGLEVDRDEAVGRVRARVVKAPRAALAGDLVQAV
jgi:uncharacterized protein